MGESKTCLDEKIPQYYIEISEHFRGKISYVNLFSKKGGLESGKNELCVSIMDTQSSNSQEFQI